MLPILCLTARVNSSTSVNKESSEIEKIRPGQWRVKASRGAVEKEEKYVWKVMKMPHKTVVATSQQQVFVLLTI